MSLGRIGAFPSFDFFSTFIKIFFVRFLRDFCTKQAHLYFSNAGTVCQMHEFARLSAGKCKTSRTNAHFSVQYADLMRIPRQHFFAPKSPFFL
jgi:hypothetical protein